MVRLTLVMVGSVVPWSLVLSQHAEHPGEVDGRQRHHRRSRQDEFCVQDDGAEHVAEDGASSGQCELQRW